MTVGTESSAIHDRQPDYCICIRGRLEKQKKEGAIWEKDFILVPT